MTTLETALIVVCLLFYLFVLGYLALQVEWLKRNKVDKRHFAPSLRKKHVPANPVHQPSSDGKERIVGYQCSVCEDTSVSKGGHSIAACERFQEEKKELALAHPEAAPDPPTDRAPGAEEPSHDD
jgi:hypothetical protein